ncbi:MAG: hypothetical protein M1823_005210 [Watsoniomyces obsoletus]|nr:MAG: hypothetical protein M1823_005210 [Watsoniomyces obsoletus]
MSGSTISSGSGKGKKRKAPEELSSNPLTKKGREYAAQLDAAHREVFKAVNADRAYRGYHLRAFKAKAEYRNAPEDEHEALADKYVERKWAERVAKEVTATHVRQRLGIELQMEVDDGHPAWEDLEDAEVDILEREEMWRTDEKVSGLEKARDVKKGEETVVQQEAMARRRFLLWKHWAVYWWRVMASLIAKKKEGLGPSAYTKKEKFMFRLMALEDEEEWYDLPGDVGEWPDDVDWEDSPWDVDPKDQEVARRIFAEMGGNEPTTAFEQIALTIEQRV